MALLQTPTDLTSTQQQPSEGTDISARKQDDPRDKKLRKLHDDFRQRVDLCKLYRRKLIANWTVNIDYRRGKPFSSQTDEDQIAVNLDWSMTKAKIAALFSQVPKVRIDHVPETLPKTAPWAVKLESRINDIAQQSGIEIAMDECLPDCVNAAGIGIILVSYEALTEDRQVPKTEPDPNNPDEQPEMDVVPHVLDKRYCIQRVSPADLLWPINFSASSFDCAPWIGRSGRVTWAEAVQKFNLSEEDKETVLGEDRPMLDRLTHDVERDKAAADEMVGFDEVFYWEYAFDPEAKSYKTIHHLVFVSGKDMPVIDEPWAGQRIQPDGSVIGAQKFPIRCLSLAYITDEPIPPSDSAIGRPQVNEINKGRTQMIRQRERNLPVRWFDVNRIDPAIQQGLMRGTWQNMIPVQGEGSRSIGEVARANIPTENFKFHEIAKQDLQEEWTMTNVGQAIEEAQGDPDQNKSNFNTQAGRERAKVASFFLSVVEVLGGLMCLYEDPSTFGQGFDPGVSTVLKVSVLADSTLLLDANQKLARLNNFVNSYAKSGWVNIEPVMQEIAMLSGLDPTIVVQAPAPKPPVEPNISLRLTGVEDMLNPLTLAFLIKSGQAPPPELIQQAKDLIQLAVQPPQGMEMQPGQAAPGGAPMLPQGMQPPALPGAGPKQLSQGLPGGPPPPPPQMHGGPPPPSPNAVPPPPPRVGEAHPNWTVMPTLNKRSE